MNRVRISSGTKWEPVMGYSRAIRVGSWVAVSGTTATDEAGAIVGGDDVYAQTRRTLKNIERALMEAGATLNDVVRTRVYVTDIRRWQEAARAHREIFGDVRPATTLVEVSRLIAPQILVEIEADAIADDTEQESREGAAV
jgi:enamine deaminase RidA (YjgF/YER057c/UK114 family)